MAADDGNVSAKLEDGSILCTPTGMSKSFIMPEKLIRIDAAGNVLEAVEGLRPFSEIMSMLKGISPLISPELLKVLMKIGYGDELVLGDGNFLAESMEKNALVIRADGHGVEELLDAILHLIPLDQYVENPAALMAVVPGDSCSTPDILKNYRNTLNRHGKNPAHIEMMECLAFYERAKKHIPLWQQGNGNLCQYTFKKRRRNRIKRLAAQAERSEPV